MTPPLYADPSANHAREFFRNKPRALVDKLTTVKDAVSNLVKDGDYVAVGGFGCDRFSSAICHGWNPRQLSRKVIRL